MTIRSDFIKALKARYAAEILVARANIQVYIDNPAGIGDHSSMSAAVDEQVQLLASASDKLNTLDEFFSPENPLSQSKK